MTNQNPPWRPWEVWTLSLGTRAAAVKWTQWNTWPQAVTTSHQYLTAVSLYVRAWAYVGQIVTSQPCEINKNFLTKHKFWNVFVDVEVLEPSSWPGETRPTRELFLELSGSQPTGAVPDLGNTYITSPIHWVRTEAAGRTHLSDRFLFTTPGPAGNVATGLHTPQRKSHTEVSNDFPPGAHTPVDPLPLQTSK